MMIQRNFALNPKFLTIAQFCERYGCSRATVYRLSRKSNAITIIKRGRSSLILFERAEEWAASLPTLGA